ncbi:EamA family transporter [Staphylococcus haemolyticus]|uniref:EamA family transporter n=1 Tax=Staphylococcus haemolyticus TaxID=1283 RepID=UPI0037096891
MRFIIKQNTDGGAFNESHTTQIKRSIICNYRCYFMGTFAFYLFIDSLKYLSPKETTLLGTIEPVIAVVTSALWLGVTFQSVQVIGIVLILILILMLSLKKQPEEM